MNRRGQVWLSAEHAELKVEFARGDKLEVIAAAHGRTPMAIVAKLSQMGLIIQVGLTGYHRIEQDPWILISMLRQMQDEEVKR